MSAPPSSRRVVQDEAAAAKALESVIGEHPFLRGLKPGQIRLLADNAMRIQYGPDQLIFREGDPANRFYLIEAGKVSLESPRAEGAAASIETVGAGDLLGWSWLFPPYYWHFDARTLEPTTAIFFYGTPLRQKCEEDHDLGYEIMKRMSAVVIQRLQATRKQLLEARP